MDVLFRFLQAVLPNDLSKDTTYVKPDQIPPFNATILLADEYGHASYRRLLGVDFITDGTVYSIQDLLTEETISYMASDFTPLMPVTHGVLFNPAITGGLSDIDPLSPSEHGPHPHARPLVRVRFRCRPETLHSDRTRAGSGGGRLDSVARVKAPAGTGQRAVRKSQNFGQPPGGSGSQTELATILCRQVLGDLPPGLPPGRRLRVIAAG